MNQASKIIPFAIVALLIVWAFTSFNGYVTDDLVWFNNSDQNGWVIYSSMDFNDGKQSKYISHPGVASSFVYGFGYNLMHALGKVEVSKSSDFIKLDDPISVLPQVYHIGSQISIFLILLCSLFMSIIVYFVSGRQLIYSLYGGLLTLMSCGFLFHSVMMRNELTSVFYFLFALMLFIVPYSKARLFTADSNRDSALASIAYLVSGFLFGLSYFSKSQIVLTAVLFFVYLLYRHLRSSTRSFISASTSIIFLIGHVVSFAVLLLYFNVTVPIFWKLIYGFFIVLSLISVVSHRYIESSLLSFVSIINRFSLGFTLTIPYIFIRGLKGEVRAQEKVLIYTSFWNPGKTSIQAQTLDKDFSSILTRFSYFMQNYFVESILIVTFLLTIYLVYKKDKKWLSYFLALSLIVIACYLNSMRSNLTANLGRSVFKYIIYIDIAAILLVVSSYMDISKIWKGNRAIVHAFFWVLLVCFGLNNYNKVKAETNWDWTTYADLVYPERWLLPGSPPSIRRIFKDKYKGFINGHDRVVFGDEIPRNGSIEIPGGEKHLMRVQKLSTEPYINKMEKLFNLDSLGIVDLKNVEARLLNVKINSFIEGSDYETILEKVTDKRKFLYKRLLKPADYKKYMQMIQNGRLSIPF